ncbi:hypothetical protein B0H14DRAFT_2625988 [Mycena olivaceomarginata]|nr:hypothetical protein B0H14DRAFT_2625988 [Mycena olivaceomarginata]
MKPTIITLTLALGATAILHIKRDDDSANAVDDSTVLNFALALEHILLRGPDEIQLGRHRERWLAQPYHGPYTDPVSFAALSQVIEDVGTSAYTGAAQYITSESCLTVAASVSLTFCQIPFSLNKVYYTIAAAFITSCPSKNPTLPVKACPHTHHHHRAALFRDIHPLRVHASGQPPGCRRHRASSRVSVEYAELENFTVVITEDLHGQVYAVVTTSDSAVDGTNTIAWPAILVSELDLTGKLIM